MLGSIEPVSAGQTNAPPTIAARATRPNDAARPDAATGALQPASPRRSSALQPASPGRAGGPASASDPLWNAVTDLLQGIGSGLQSDTALQTLIALVILLAVLENLQDNAAAANPPFGPRSADQNIPPPTMAVYSSTTTITIEQSSTMISLGGSGGLEGAFGQGPASSPGGQIDVSA